jgi:SAM-dependent methyltransferase
MPFDEEKVRAFAAKMFVDLGGASSVALALAGDRLGLWKGMAGAGPLTPADLAARTSTAERYVREWLCAMAAAEYVTYDAASGRFTLPDEHVPVLADESTPATVLGGLQSISVFFKDEAKLVDAFRSGKGVAWGDHHPDLFQGTERFFRPGYQAHLVAEWIPALDGVDAKLRRGARVADVACGHGVTTLLMAKAYPESTFVGFDFHAPSIERARRLAAEEGLADRVSFEVATAKTFPGTGYDLVSIFDSLHDMGDPVGAAAHVRQALAPDGTWLLVEPFAHDRIEDNLNPIGRIFYAASSFICTPASLSQEVGLGLGAQAGEARLRDVVTQGGFGHFRRATETPFNLVFEARP